jgi:hypothetical protein
VATFNSVNIMPKFLFYITDLYMGEILGTNSLSVAEDCACSEDMFVVDTLNGEWILPDLSRRPIEEARA